MNNDISEVLLLFISLSNYQIPHTLVPPVKLNLVIYVICLPFFIKQHNKLGRILDGSVPGRHLNFLELANLKHSWEIDSAEKYSLGEK